MNREFLKKANICREPLLFIQINHRRYEVLDPFFLALRVKDVVNNMHFGRNKNMPRRGENIRKRKDGRWEGRYRVENESQKDKYISVYGKTYAEVKDKLLLQKANRSPHILPHKSFGDILLLWLNTTSLKHKKQTYRKYKMLIDNHIIPDLGSMRIDRVDIATINNIIAKKYSSGRLDGTGGLSASYIQTICYIINASLSFAVKNGYRDSLKGDIVRPSVPKCSIEILSRAEQDILEKYLVSQTDYQMLGVLLSLYLGLRLGETCGLKWEDFDFDTNSVSVCRSIERVPNTTNSGPKTQLLVTKPKTESSIRVLPIPARIRDVLLNMKSSKNEYVIPGQTYAYTDPRTLQYSYKKVLKKCHLRNIHYHSLRHTFATRCVEAGMDVKTLSEILGHSNINVTLNVYVHSSLEYKQKQIDTVFVCGQ